MRKTGGRELVIKKNKSGYVDDFTAVDQPVLVGLYHLNLFCRKVRGEVQLILTMELSLKKILKHAVHQTEAFKLICLLSG